MYKLTKAFHLILFLIPILLFISHPAYAALSLTQPAGGEVIDADTSYTITWLPSDSPDAVTQEIRLSTDSGLSYPTLITSGLSFSTQSFNWPVPSDLSTSKARIKIICLDSASNIIEESESEGDFSVLGDALPVDMKDTSYEYDNLNRLTRSLPEEGIENNYTYDALGNRLNLTTSGTQEWRLILPVPWYLEEKSYYSAAASSKMTLDYIRQDSTLTQDEIYNYVAAGLTRELNPQDVRTILNHFKPGAYNFTIIVKADILDAMRDIAHWMDYEVPNTAVPNTSVLIPAFGGYDNWMVVRGAAASEDPNANQHLWQTASFTVYGFWLNDPAISGIGENSYKTAAELQSTYYLPLSTADTWAGKYVAVAEPPRQLSRARIKIADHYLNEYNRDLGDLAGANDQVEANDQNETELKAQSMSVAALSMNTIVLKPSLEKMKNKFRRFNWKKIIDPHLLKDNNFESAIKNTFAGRPIKVNRLDAPGKFYYLLPLERIRGAKSLTAAVLVIDGSDFSFKEASWVKNPVNFPKISRQQAILLAKRKNPISFIDRKGKSLRIKSELVWQSGALSSSPYRPFWRILVGNKTWFVTEEGKVFSADSIK